MPPDDGDSRPVYPYRGAQMTSRLAVAYAKYLERCGATDWVYGPADFITHDGVGWIPDFRIGTGRVGYIAVRPVLAAPPLIPTDAEVRHVDEMLRRMESAWRQAGPCVLTLTYMPDEAPAEGEPEPSPACQIDCAGPGCPWLWRIGGDVTSFGVWPGMGQMAALRRHSEHRPVLGPPLSPAPETPGPGDLEGGRQPSPPS